MWLLGCAVSGWCAVAHAQTYYKWTDTTGVVHFSDQAPLNTVGVEERRLTAPPPPPPKAEPAEQVGAPGAAAQPGGGEAKAVAAGRPPEGPARVIVVSHQAPRISPSAVHVIGEVKNVGGADARRVAVALTAVDNTQGNPCFREEAEVTPTTLHPGESGNFDVDVDSPCFYGQNDLDIAPVWE